MGGGGVRSKHRHRGLDRPEAVLRLGQRRPARASTRSSSGRRCASSSSSAGGVPDGRPIQAVLLGGAAGVFVGPDALDTPLTFEGDARDRRDARLGRRDGVRRDGRPGRHAAADRRVLPRRVVRPVRPLPRRDGPPGGAARAAASRAAPTAAATTSSPCSATSARRCATPHLRPRADGVVGDRVGAAPAGAGRAVSDDRLRWPRPGADALAASPASRRRPAADRHPAPRRRAPRPPEAPPAPASRPSS